MKLTLALTVGFVMGWLAFMTFGNTGPSRDKRLEAYGYSYQTGCLGFAQYSCSKLPTEEQEGQCREVAMEACPKGAARFVRWISSGGRG